MAVTWITPTEITPGAAGAWTDADLSALIPAGATGVLLHIVNTSGTTYTCGWRKNGSTDARTNNLRATHHRWVAIGCDGSRIIELYVGHTTNIDVYLVGAFGAEATFDTNATDVSLSGTGAWTDIDVSGITGAATAIGVCIEGYSDTGSNWGLRPNGSTDNRLFPEDNHWSMIVGVDGSEILEAQIASVNTDMFVNGWFTSGFTFLTNATDLSLGSTGAWTDLSALPAGATGAILEATNSSASNYGLRKDGSSESILQRGRHSLGLIEALALVVEGQIASTGTDFWLLAYMVGGVDHALVAEGFGLGIGEGMLGVNRALAAEGLGVGMGEAFAGVDRKLVAEGLGVGLGEVVRHRIEVTRSLYPVPEFRVIAQTSEGDWRWPSDIGSEGLPTMRPLNCACEHEGVIYVGASRVDTWTYSETPQYPVPSPMFGPAFDTSALEKCSPTRSAVTSDEALHFPSGGDRIIRFFRDAFPSLATQRVGSALLHIPRVGTLEDAPGFSTAVAAVFCLTSAPSGLLAGCLDVYDGTWHLSGWRLPTGTRQWERLGGIEVPDWDGGQAWSWACYGVTGIQERADRVYLTTAFGVICVEGGNASSILDWQDDGVNRYCHGLIRWRSGLATKRFRPVGNNLPASSLGNWRLLSPPETWGDTDLRYQCPNSCALLDGLLYGLRDLARSTDPNVGGSHWTHRAADLVVAELDDQSEWSHIMDQEGELGPPWSRRVVRFDHHIRGVFRWAGGLLAYGVSRPDWTDVPDEGEVTLQPTLDLLLPPRFYSSVAIPPAVLWSVNPQEDLGVAYAIAMSPPSYRRGVVNEQETYIPTYGMPSFYVLRFSLALQTREVAYEYAAVPPETPTSDGVIYEYARAHSPQASVVRYEYGSVPAGSPTSSGVVYEYGDGLGANRPQVSAVAYAFGDGSESGQPTTGEIAYEWARRAPRRPNVRLVAYSFSDGSALGQPLVSRVSYEYDGTSRLQPSVSAVTFEYHDGLGGEQPETTAIIYEFGRRPAGQPTVSRVLYELSDESGDGRPTTRGVSYEWADDLSLQDGEDWVSVLHPLSGEPTKQVGVLCVIPSCDPDEWASMRAFVRVDNAADVALRNDVDAASVTSWPSYDEVIPVGQIVRLRRPGGVIRVTLVKPDSLTIPHLAVALPRGDEPED